MSEEAIKIGVVNHWFNDSGDVEIVLVKSLNSQCEIGHDLFWFSGSNMPNLKSGTVINSTKFETLQCYKQKKFESIEQDIPNDCYMPIV